VLCGGVVSFVPVVVLVFVREKTRHARLVGNKNGIKLSQQEQNAPNWEILGVQGEFCTGTAGPNSRGESVAPIVPPHSVDGGCEVGITKPPAARGRERAGPGPRCGGGGRRGVRSAGGQEYPALKPASYPPPVKTQ